MSFNWWIFLLLRFPGIFKIWIPDIVNSVLLSVGLFFLVPLNCFPLFWGVVKLLSLILVLLLRFARQEWAAFTLMLIISYSWVKRLLSTLLDAPWSLRLFTPLGGNGRCILPDVCSRSSCFWFFPTAALHSLENVLNSMTSLSYNCTCLTKPHSESVWGLGSFSLYLCPWKKIKQWHIES